MGLKLSTETHVYDWSTAIKRQDEERTNLVCVREKESEKGEIGPEKIKCIGKAVQKLLPCSSLELVFSLLMCLLDLKVNKT